MTAHTEDRAGLVDELVDALAALGIEASAEGDVLVADGTRLVPHVVGRAHPTPADLGALVGQDRGRLPAVVVADRISEAGRRALRDAGWGWLDRRGHLRLWAPGIRVEAPLPEAAASSGRTGPSNAWTTVGLEIALVALWRPEEPVTARRVAAVTGRSVGATHELIGRLVELGLVGPRTHLPLLPELFWEASAHWPDDGWIGLPASLAEVAERVGADQVVRVDERAAALGGARIAASGDLPARCYLRSSVALRRARGLAEKGAPTRTWVRASPVAWLPPNPDHHPDDQHPWQVAHPLVCALRLAADPARGREIVDAWGIVPSGPA
ncbi:MAG: hypothetical protein U0P45_15600 [Acidimicrobiales bacterium]